MRIALLSVPANFHCRKWAAALARAGAEVSVYTLDEPAPIAGVQVVSIPTRMRLGGRYRFPAYWTTAPELARRLRDDGTDLLHPLHLTPFGLWGLWSGFRPMIPAAIGADVFDFLPRRLTPAGHLHWSATARGFSPSRLKHEAGRPLYRRWLRRLVQQADALTCDNEPLRQALVAGFGAAPDRVRLVRWGVNTGAAPPDPATARRLAEEFGWPADAELVLAPRGANAFYGADVILEAFETLIVSGTLPAKFCFVLLSAGYAVSPSIEEKSRMLEATGRFRFVRRTLAAEEMRPLWSRTAAFVSAPAYDGFSAAETEGRWAGALPVLNDIPAHREWAEDGRDAWLVEPFTAERLAETLAALLPQADALRPAAAELNRAWIREHADLDGQAREFLELAGGLG